VRDVEGAAATEERTMIPGLGTRIARARQDAGLSQEALAEVIGMSRHSLSWIESGRTTNPGVEWITKIADATGVSIAWLVGTPDENTEDTHAS
jgi:transcriptional regulator with XRE-family HTH domain